MIVRPPRGFFETGRPNRPLNVVSLRSDSAKCVALGSAYMLYMDENVGECVPHDASRPAFYGEYVCWIAPFDDWKIVLQWLTLGYGDPEWLWRHEALVFGARYLAEHTPANAKAIEGLQASNLAAAEGPPAQLKHNSAISRRSRASSAPEGHPGRRL
jgi:hypothetical protein